MPRRSFPIPVGQTVALVAACEAQLHVGDPRVARVEIQSSFGYGSAPSGVCLTAQALHPGRTSVRLTRCEQAGYRRAAAFELEVVSR